MQICSIKTRIEKLYKQINKFKGKQRLKINIIDRTEPDLSIPVISKLGIKVSPKLLKTLEEMKLRIGLN